MIVIGGYSEVAFGGKTFNTAQVAAGVNACKPSQTKCPIIAKAKNDPRLDLLPQPWALDPWAQVTSAELHAHQIPLWTPYQAAGAPLAANMESGVFDPLLLAVNLHPTVLVWDITLLAVLALNGIATFALARVLGLRRWAASAAGVIYGLSGYFFLASNNSFVRIYLYVPVTLLAIEWILRRRGLLPVLAFALSVAGCIVVGMPEPILINLTAAALYGLARLFTGPRFGSRAATLGRLAAGGVAGLMFASPLVLPFAEYLAHATTFKQGAGSRTFQRVDLLNWAAPKIQSTIWTETRNWVGGAAIVAAVAGVASPARMRRYCGWAFLAVGALLAAKIYGAPIISLVGHLPGAAQTLWPTWGTPEIALPIALIAGIGVESVFTGGVDLRLFTGLLLGGLIVAGYFAVNDRQLLRLGPDGFAIGGWGLAAAAATVVVVLVVWQRPRMAGVLIVLMIVVELVVLAPRGFYSPRRTPYPREAWIDTLVSLAKSPGNARVFSTDGLLFADTPGAYGLADLRVIDPVYIERYFKYFRTFVAPGTVDRWLATGPTEGFPSIFDNPMFDLMGARYFPQKRPFAHPDQHYHVIDKVDGVLIYENTAAFPRAFVVHQVHVVKNEAATVAYLKSGSTKDYEGAVHPVMNPRTHAVIEASTPGVSARTNDPTCTATTGESATITHYDASRVEIHVQAGCAGLVVLSDTYFPGWTTTVNGRSGTIYPTDLAFRGIAVPAGRSTVVLRYRPSSFRDGLILASLSGAGFLVVALFLVLRRRRARPPERSAQPA